MNRIRKAVIPVAGFGTRFLPATIAQPKEMLTVVDKPVIQYIVEELVASGIEEIIFVTGRGKRAIEDHFDYSAELEELLEGKGKKELLEEVKRISSLAKFVYVRQHKPLGNGHALLCAKEIVGNEPFAFSYGDDIIDSRVPALKQMIKAYEKYRDLIMGVVEVPRDKVSSYGIVRPKQPPHSPPISAKRKQGNPHLSPPISPRAKQGELEGVDDVFEISGVVEKPDLENAPSRFANPGRYIFNPDIFDYLEKTKPGKGGEIWIADAVEKVFRDKAVYACKINGTYYDCGNKLEYIKANVAYALKRKDMGEEFEKYLKGLKL